MKKLAVLMLVMGLSCPAAEAADDPGLARILAGAAARFPGKFTAYVKQLPSGAEASVAGDEPMSSMSVIKLGILVKAYQMAEQKRLNLDERMTMKVADLRGGSGVLQFHGPGLNPTLRDLLWEMVITSDNTATEAMLTRTGGVDELNRWYASAGFPQMRMHFTIGAYFAHLIRVLAPTAKGLSEQELNAMMVGQRASEMSAAGKEVAAAFGRAGWGSLCAPLADAGNWLGTITARSTGDLLEKMETGALATKEHSGEMTGMLKGQQAGARRIPIYLGTQYAIGHKTGDAPPCTANDVGIVYLKSGPTVMVFLTDQIRGNYGEAETRIGEVARTVAEYLDGK